MSVRTPQRAAVDSLVMEASRATPATPHPLDDPAELAAHRERLHKLRLELEAEMTDAERARSDRLYEELVERSKHWPE